MSEDKKEPPREATGKAPDCFGSWDKVFPMGADGLRAVAASCRECTWVKDCLAAGADSPEGRRFRADRLVENRPDQGRGLLGFLSRWSTLKGLNADALKRKRK